jgi:hypothetical protein
MMTFFASIMRKFFHPKKPFWLSSSPHTHYETADVFRWKKSMGVKGRTTQSDGLASEA